MNNLQGATGNVTLDTLCDIMGNESIGMELNRYATVSALVNDGECVDISYNKMVQDLKETSWSSEAAEGGKLQISQIDT